ncbi:MAG: NAD(P)-binding protein [Actinomycetota bacterium]|nr:NAD(P)-binding protein [Actinomycetota bacterium]
MTDHAVVVGGGISGAACASALLAAGAPVRLLDRGRRLGGRMASRTLRGTGTPYDGRVVDIGASYFTVSDPGFATVVDALQDAGVVRPWTTGFHVAGPEGLVGIKSGAWRYAAPGGLRSVVEAMAAPLPDVRLDTEVQRVEAAAGGVVVDGQPAGAAALCVPYPQARRLTSRFDFAGPVWEPVIAVTCVFAEASWPEIDGVFVNDDPVLTWIADDGSRRGDQAPVLVAHVHPVLSARHLGDPQSVIPAAIATIQRVLGIRDYPEWAEAKRWAFAKPLGAESAEFWLDEDAPIGLAGDAFAGGPRIEAAWLSGHQLGAALATRLDA